MSPAHPIHPTFDMQPLFEPPTTCAHCGALNKADCEHDREYEASGQLRRRPKTCLAHYDPATAPLPEGY